MIFFVSAEAVKVTLNCKIKKCIGKILFYGVLVTCYMCLLL